MEKYRKLPESELAVMQAIWEEWKQDDREHISAGRIMEKDSGLSELKLTTVLTLISRLAAKGFLETRKGGRVNYYRPLVDEEVYKQQAAADFVATVYHNDSCGLLCALWDGGTLSGEDVEELRKMIEQWKPGDKDEKGRKP